MGKEKFIRVVLRKSGIGYNERQKKTLSSLGLRKIDSERTLKDTPTVRGMINRVSHLVEVEDVEG